MTLSLYAHRLSQPCRAAEILLRELAIDYTFHEIDFANGETREPWFAQRINPLQTVPALTIPAQERNDGADGFVIGESHAIMRYLCRTAPARDAANLWYPAERDAALTARIDQWMAWHHSNVRAYDLFHDVMNLHLTLPMLKYEIQDTALKPLQDGLNQGLATLEQHFERQATDQPTHPTLCGGDHPTLADLTMACELYQVVTVGYRFDRYPRVSRWLDAMAQRQHFRHVSAEIIDQGQTIREASGGYLDLKAFA